MTKTTNYICQPRCITVQGNNATCAHCQQTFSASHIARHLHQAQMAHMPSGADSAFTAKVNQKIAANICPDVPQVAC